MFVLIFVTVYHDACIENLLWRLILCTFRIKLKVPPPSNEWFYFEPPLSWQQFYVMPPPSSFSAPLLIIIAQSLNLYILQKCRVYMLRSCLYSLLVSDQKNKKSPELAKNPTQQFVPTWSSFVFWLYKKVFPQQYINIIK